MGATSGWARPRPRGCNNVLPRSIIGWRAESFPAVRGPDPKIRVSKSQHEPEDWDAWHAPGLPNTG
jgi:hypothetical protein